MKATSHNKILGILHLAYGGLSALLMIGASVLMIGVIAINSNSGKTNPIGILALMIFVVALSLLLITP